jgi:LL-diaminopimelate aminotransferase
MPFQPARRIRELPPYLFAEIDALRAAVRARGVDVIDLGVGDPDLPTPVPIVEACQAAVARAANHRYPSYIGMPEFRRVAAAWMRRRFGVELDPDREIVALIGSKEGLAHLPIAAIDPGDVSLVPDPGYPVYATATRFAGGEVHRLPLSPERGFLPNLDAVPAAVRARARLFFFNYPNNPTSAGATLDDYQRYADFCAEHDIVAVSDNAYSEVYPGDARPPSFLQAKGAREVGIEFHSLSKTFNMTGWRIGFACGNADVVAALAKVKTNVDSGQFTAVQEAAIRALELEEDLTPPLRRIWERRRAIMVEALEAHDIDVYAGAGTFYVWARCPAGYTSAAFTRAMLEKAGVIVTPGNGFGPSGEGWFRISLTSDEARLKEAARRIRGLDA